MEISFHAQNSVAPLKLRVYPYDERLRRKFPRTEQRGPIEASWYGSDNYKNSQFPRTEQRGPIEAGPSLIDDPQ